MGDNVLTQPAAGGTIARTPEEAAVVKEAFGTPQVSQEGRDAEARAGRAVANLGDADGAVGTFVEGIVDAASLGYIREPGEAGDDRRAANPKSHMVGEILGTILSLEYGGPAARVSEAGELAGQTIARGVLRQGEKSILTRALSEAGAGAALTGAQAFGHQVVDSVIEDKDFSSEAILHEAKLGGVVGLIGGGVLGVFGKVATRADIEAQGGLLGDTTLATKHLDEAFRAYDDALNHHAMQVGALRELQLKGDLPEVSDGFMDVRRAALRDAERARDAFRKLDHEAPLSGKDPEAYRVWQERAAEYREAVRDLDDIMRPDKAEVAGQEASVAQRADAVVEKAPRGGLVAPGRSEGYPGGDSVARELDAYFANNPEAAAKYEALHGRPWEPTPPAPMAAQNIETPSTTAATRQGKGPVPPPPGSLDDLNRLVFASPEESAERAMMRIGENRIGTAAYRAAKPVGLTRLRDVQDAARQTVMEALPYGAAVGALDKAAAAEAKAAAKAPTLMEDTRPTAVDLQPQSHPDDIIHGWMKAPRIRPFEEAEARVRSAMDDLYKASGGRMDSAGALGLLERSGLKRSTDPLVQHADALWSMRRAAKLAADEARGVATPLREAAVDAVKQALGAFAGRGLGKLVGHEALGLAAGLMGFGGRLGAASGRLLGKAVGSVLKLMTSNRLRALAVGVAENRAWAYSDRGPITDPVERIQEIQFLAGNPDAVRAKVAQSAGTLAQASPELVRSLQERAVAQVMRLSMRAPAIYFDKLGKPISPPAGKMREFLEYENGIHDLGSLLDALGNGSLTRPQAAALQEGWPSVHLKIAQAFLADQEKLQTLGRAQLRIIEMVTGMPLTNASDPMFLARQMHAWAPVDNPEQPAQAPQAFNINPDGAPLPSQSSSGRAPGN